MKPLSDRQIAGALVVMVFIAIAAAAYGFGKLIGEREEAHATYAEIGAGAARAKFSDLDGWLLDDVGAALPVFIKSCARFEDARPDAPANPNENFAGAPGFSVAGAAKDWAAVCKEARRVMNRPYADDNARTSAARDFFQSFFRPVRLYRRLQPDRGADEAARFEKDGRFTAYFEPFYDAVSSPSPEFSAPVYERPDDLVSVDLGAFRADLKGRRIAGRVEKGSLKPYPARAAIGKGVLNGRARVIAYMRPNDLFFLQIQGSGRLIMPGREIRVGYDGANGRDYVAIGRTLIAKGALTRDNVSMQTIRAWLDKASPKDAAALRNENASYVFFRILPGLADERAGPFGAAGVQLAAGRSLAVDARYTPLGAPVWVETAGDEDREGSKVNRLFIAQDIGGAIKGGVRGDIFVGSGPRAGAVAGGFNQEGEMYVLAPRGVADSLPKAPGAAR